MVVVHQVRLELTASGDVDWYDAQERSKLVRRAAKAAGVEPERVTLLIVAASVLVRITIEVTEPAAGEVIRSRLLERMHTADAASSLLAITVEKSPTVDVVQSATEIASPSTPPTPSPPVTTPLAPDGAAASNFVTLNSASMPIVIALGLVVAMLTAVLLGIVIVYCRKRRNATTTRLKGIQAVKIEVDPSRAKGDEWSSMVGLNVHDFSPQLDDLSLRPPAYLPQNSSDGIPTRPSDALFRPAADTSDAPSYARTETVTVILKVSSGPLGISLFDAKDGVAVSSIEDGSPAMAQGVQVGSLVLAVNGQSTHGLDKIQVLGAIKDAERPISLLFRPTNEVRV